MIRRLLFLLPSKLLPTIKTVRRANMICNHHSFELVLLGFNASTG